MHNLRPREKKSAALILDYDGTAVHGNMIDSLLLMRGYEPAAFWAGVDTLSLCGVDPTVAFIRQFEHLFINSGNGITEFDLARVGGELEVLPGLIEALVEARGIAAAADVELLVLVLTSGFETVVRSSELATHVDAVVGTTWHSAEGGILSTADQIVTADAKGKCIVELADLGLTGKGIPPIQMNRIGFIGDGLTDFAGFQILASGGGAPLLVHLGDAETTQTAREQARSIPGLCSAPRDYHEGSQAHSWLKNWVSQISAHSNEILSEVIR